MIIFLDGHIGLNILVPMGGSGHNVIISIEQERTMNI